MGATTWPGGVDDWSLDPSPARQDTSSPVSRKPPEIPGVFALFLAISNGGGGIRTHGTLAGTPVFKTGAFNRSATPPGRVSGRFQHYTWRLIRSIYARSPGFMTSTGV